jgi:phage FluMu protein Com
MDEEFVTIRCATCSGVAHPASGCAYTPTFIVCGPCTRAAWTWIRQHTANKGRRRGPSFYEHVNTIAPAISIERA